MLSFSPNDLETWTGGNWRGSVPGAVHGFAIDSRKLRKGDMFVGLRSDRRDGHDFLGDAMAKGASCALVSRLIADLPLPQLLVADPLNGLQHIAAAHRQSFQGPVVAVTGSCGKTSTKDLLAELLAAGGPVLRTEGNLNNHIGVPLTILRLDPQWHSAAVIEAGIDRRGEMSLLAGMIQPTHAIVTLVAPVHLDKLGDLETIAREKARIAEGIHGSGFTVFPYSCLRHTSFQNLGCGGFAGKPSGVKDEEAGRSFNGKVIPFAIERSRERTRISLERDCREARDDFDLRPELSRGMAGNAALAIIAALAMGIGEEAVRERLPAWKAACFRGESRRSQRKEFFVDCYNANPVALEDALDAFAFFAREGDRARLYIIGSMEELGVEAPAYHFEALKTLRLAPDDYVYLIGCGAADMERGLRAAGNKREQWKIVNDLSVVRDRLEVFEGAVFLKGSRRYRLESLLDEHADKQEAAC